MLEGKLRVLGGEVTATQESSQLWKAKLAGGEIDLAALGDWLDIEIEIAGVVNRLEATLDAGAEFPVRAEIGTSQLAYQKYGSDTATASIAYSKAKIDVSDISVRSGGSTVTGSGTFLPETKTLNAQAKLEAPDLAELTSNYGLQEVGGSVSADIAEFELTGGEVVRAKLSADATGLTYGGATVAQATLAATEDSFDLKADLHGDASNRIHSSGGFDIGKTSYEAKAEVDLPKLAALHPILEALKVEQRPGGKITLNWEGSGTIRDQQHQGSAVVPEFDLQLDPGAPVSGQLNFSYEPGGYRLSDFTARS